VIHIIVEKQLSVTNELKTDAEMREALEKSE
jgi:hypothetical protein